MEDILIYFKNGQTRRYNQKREDKLYKILERLDPEQDWMKWTTTKRIKYLKKQGVK
jgi:hypothetical protein